MILHNILKCLEVIIKIIHILKIYSHKRLNKQLSIKYLNITCDTCKPNARNQTSQTCVLFMQVFISYILCK